MYRDDDAGGEEDPLVDPAAAGPAVVDPAVVDPTVVDPTVAEGAGVPSWCSVIASNLFQEPSLEMECVVKVCLCVRTCCCCGLWVDGTDVA